MAAKILLFVIVTNLLVTFVTTGTTDDEDALASGCTTSNTTAECEPMGRESFFQRLVATTVSGFEGAPLLVNVPWGVIMGTLLTVGILLAISAFIPTLSG